MTPVFVVRPAVEEEVADAAEWYERRANGLGLDFLRAVEVALSEVRAAPERFPRVLGEMRRALLRRYPYAVFYTAAADRIEVLACLHTRRDPHRWQSRR